MTDQEAPARPTPDPHNRDDPGYHGRPVDDPDGEAAALDQEQEHDRQIAWWAQQFYSPEYPQCPAVDAGGLECAGPAGHPDGSNHHANVNGTWPLEDEWTPPEQDPYRPLDNGEDR